MARSATPGQAPPRRWNDAHKSLTDLRGGKDTDNKAVGDIVKKYDDQLKAPSIRRS